MGADHMAAPCYRRGSCRKEIYLPLESTVEDMSRNRKPQCKEEEDNGSMPGDLPA